MLNDLTLTAVAKRTDLSHTIRRLGAFSQTVEAGLGQFNERYGLTLAISRKALTRCFVDWTREFEAQRHLADRDRRDFSHFAAGLLMRGLIRQAPVGPGEGTGEGAAAARPGGAVTANPIVGFWPEGFFYFEFCITVLDAVLAEQNLQGVDLAPQALELRSWESFRENVREDPDRAIPFFDLFLGGDPNWDFPTVARFREALRGRLLDGAAARPDAPVAPGQKQS